MQLTETENRKLKDLIKAIMKKKSYTYEDLAKAMNVSVPTVKRILNRDELSLPRFLFILEWLGMSLTHIAKLAEEGEHSDKVEYSVEQEQFLADHPHHFYILMELRQGFSVEQLTKKFNLTKKSMQKYLIDLDRCGLIELQANDRVKLNRAHPSDALAGGPIERTYRHKAAEVISEANLWGFGSRDDDPKIRYKGNFGMRLRPQTFKKLQDDILALESKYTTISYYERTVEKDENLLIILYSFVVAQMNGREKLFGGPPRNFEDETEPQTEATV